jgi:hypothetical protein
MIITLIILATLLVITAASAFGGPIPRIVWIILFVLDLLALILVLLPLAATR